MFLFKYDIGYGGNGYKLNTSINRYLRGSCLESFNTLCVTTRTPSLSPIVMNDLLCNMSLPRVAF